MEIKEFTLPEFLQNCDVETIHEKMLEELPQDIDHTEGGFVWDFTRPTALIAAELLEFYIPETIKLFFWQWSRGKYLDYIGTMARVSRKAANQATAKLEIEGIAGTVIPAGTVFATPSKGEEPSIEFESTGECILDERGHGEVDVRALIPGRGSNVGEGTITLMSSPISGITSITNPEKATGGTEEESDDEFRERIGEAFQIMDDSYIGNNADYKRWAESVAGIGAATVIPTWNGPETVKIVCLDSNGEAANQGLLDAVYNLIMSPDHPLERLAPPNVILTVSPPELIEVSYAVTVELEDDFELDAVVEEFKKRLDAYYRTVAEEGMVKYIMVHSILTNTPGIKDFTELTMNGATENVSVAQGEYPRTIAVDAKEAEK